MTVRRSQTPPPVAVYARRGRKGRKEIRAPMGRRAHKESAVRKASVDRKAIKETGASEV